MKRNIFRAAIFCAVMMTGFIGKLFACGPCFPNNLLDDGDHAVLQPPLVDFRGELERMKLTTKLHAVPLAGGQSFNEQSTKLEMQDLSAALKREKVSSELATTILQAHLAERMKLNQYLDELEKWSSYREWVYDTNGTAHLRGSTNPAPHLPEIAVTPGLPPEFALYFKGVIAWHQSGDWQAINYWQQVLVLPESERKFKSTWAAFMLGKYYESQTNDWSDDEALKYYEQVRMLAKHGFTDSSGLAVASIGNEARIYLHRKDYARAIELYLEQYAAGDPTALVSLRFAASAAIGDGGATEEQLKSLAANSRTRRVITAYAISRHPYNSRRYVVGNPEANSFFDGMDRWLATVESAHVQNVESAERFALAAYQADDMDTAQRWINRAGRNNPVAMWLQAKLDMRAGKLDDAARLLAKVSRKFPQELPGTNTPASFAQNLFVEVNPEYGDRLSAGRQSLGELGVLHLARREYVEALDALLRSGYWMDATYVAERVLTTDELKKYVDRHWPRVSPAKAASETRDWPDGDSGMTNPREQIRYLLARRLARETGSRDAQPYFPTQYSVIYGNYLADLHDGRDESLPVETRARQLFAAAVMARTNGMELFGTELQPDWAIYGGEYAFGLTWQMRTQNVYAAQINFGGTNEIERASSRHVIPDERFHYRWQAAALAWEAAQLMPDNSDETARVLCTGGTWIKDRDPKAADKFYKALVRRCGRTTLGQRADKIRWFPAQDIGGGPPRLETIEITPELTNSVSSDRADEYSTEYPVPGRKYVVHEAEDVFVIARAVQRLGCPMTVDEIRAANPGIGRGPLPVGEIVMIPCLEQPASENSNKSAAIYMVLSGDSLAKIAKRFGVSVSALIDANHIGLPRLKIGQKLLIPYSENKMPDGDQPGEELKR